MYSTNGRRAAIRYTNTVFQNTTCRTEATLTMAENRDDKKALSELQDGAGDSDPEVDLSQINEKSLLRKLDARLLPAVGILYLLSFLDRSNGRENL